MEAPLISVILPVYNGAEHLRRSLPALRRSRLASYELIVVDDHSSDGTAQVLQEHPPDQLLRTARTLGHAACRNLGAAVARGRILVFTDADVLFADDTLARCAAHFVDPAVACVIGCYGLAHPNRDLPSLYKNAWIHYSYQRAAEQAGWFFTAIGALRRELFTRHGPFQESLGVRYGGGDVELGLRLRAAGVPILLDKALQVTHLKRFDLRSLLLNDLRRARGWTEMALHRGLPALGLARRGLANVSGGFTISALLAWLGVLALALAPLRLALGPWLLYLTVNGPFLRFLGGALSPCGALQALPLLCADHLAAGAGVAAGLWRHCARRRDR